MNDNSVSSTGILMRKEQIAIIALAAWLTVLTVFMLVTQSVNLEILFVLSLIGCFIIVEQITPKYVRPGYLQYIRYVLVDGGNFIWGYYRIESNAIRRSEMLLL